MHDHLLHTRHLLIAGQLFVSPHAAIIPLLPSPVFDLHVQIERESPFAERAAPHRYASPSNDLRGAVLLVLTIHF